MMRISILTLIKRILRGIKNVMLIFLCYVGVSILLCLVRCNRDEYNYFDRMMLAGWNTSDTIVDLSRLTPFQWDTMQDVIIFKDKEGRTVYWDKWVYSWDYAHDRGFRIVVPRFPDSYLRVSSDDALFIVRLKTKRTIMLEHLPRGKVRQN